MFDPLLMDGGSTTSFEPGFFQLYMCSPLTVINDQACKGVQPRSNPFPLARPPYGK